MTFFFLKHYEWLKAFHVIAMICWMAGLLYLPRLFVYHSEAKPGSEMSETFKVMERRLLKIIMNPAMIAAWVFGLLMLYGNWEHLSRQGWMHTKLLLVIILTGVHHVMVKYVRDFAQDHNRKSVKFYRIFNEVPTGIMVLVVILVMTKGF